MEFDVSREFLRELAAFGDIAYIGMDKCSTKRKRSEAEEVLRSVGDYFVLLTIKALEDKELAEHLVEVYGEISRESMNLLLFFETLEIILSLKHWLPVEGETIDPERTERRIEWTLNHPDLDGVLEDRETYKRLRWLNKIERAIIEDQAKMEHKKDRDDNVMWG